MDFKRIFRPLYYKMVLCRKVEMEHNALLKSIRKRGYANVVFFASNLAMWRYQGILELMMKDKRFKTHLILSTLKTYSEEQKEENLKTMRAYFEGKNIPFYDSSKWKNEDFNIRQSLFPDIMFYPQHYDTIFNNPLDNKYFEDKLLCYAPYGVGTLPASWNINTRFHNIAWKLFYDTEIFKKNAQEYAYNKGRNACVVGNANADDFMKIEHKDVWKPQHSRKKRIIWAPHFTIEQKQKVHRGSFLWLWDVMLDIAKTYSDKVQIAFKPHPRLKSVLYDYPGWGKKNTDEYYRQWAEMSNTQYENSEFIDLFMTSDAMIHDCGSFTVEYHYSMNPAMFTSHVIDEVRMPLNQLGREAIDAHYLGKTVGDVKHFIDEVVLQDNDPMFSVRKAFYQKYLLPPNGNTVADNMLNEIVTSIWG